MGTVLRSFDYLMNTIKNHKSAVSLQEDLQTDESRVSRVRSQVKPGPEVIKLFSCSTQLSMKFIMLINNKMPTIVGILIFMNMISTTSEILKGRKIFIFKHFRFYKHLKIPCSVELSTKKVL